MMLFRRSQFDAPQADSFNLTPIIDIVFLLIIFFMLLCQFIVAENFPVDVPDSCKFAQDGPEYGPQIVTVTVMKTAKDEICFAVGSEKIDASSHSDVVEGITELINARLENLPPQDRIVTLRVDRKVCFTEAQYALAGIAASSAKNIHLAALKNDRIDLE